MHHETMKYKGFIGTIKPDAENHILRGSVQGQTPPIKYEANTIARLEAEFHRQVDGLLLNKPKQEAFSTPKIGRPPKGRETRFNKKITVSFTQTEYDLIKREAGDVPLARFLKLTISKNIHLNP